MVPPGLAMARTYAYANSFVAVILLVVGQLPTAHSYNVNAGSLPSVLATTRNNVRALAPPHQLIGASLIPRHHRPVGIGQRALDLRGKGRWRFPRGGGGGGGAARCSSSARGRAVVLWSSSGDDASSSRDASFPHRSSSSSSSRRDFFAASSTPSAVALLFLTTAQSSLLPPRPPPSALAFDGGVGGLGKTKPETGVVFRDPETVIAPADGNGMIATELICPGDDDGGGGKTVLVSFYAPWPMLRSTSSVESRDLANPEAAFLLVVPLPKKASKARVGDGEGNDSLLTTEFFRDTIFAQSGKFGAYGAPSDVRVKKLPRSDGGGGASSGVGASSSDSPTTSTPTLYVATFTTLTPAMRESERKAYVSAEVVRSSDGGGGGVFMLVAGTTRARFERNEATLRRVAESFRAVEAPRSALAPGRRDGGSK